MANFATEGGPGMAAKPIVTPNLIPDTQQTVSQTGKPKLESLLERMEEVLRKALGDDEDTIRNSLGGL